MAMSKQLVNSMTKDFLMTNVFDDCYIFEYIEQIITKQKMDDDDGGEIFTDLKSVRRKDIVKMDEDVFDHKEIIDDANNLGNKFTFFFYKDDDEKDKKLYRELLVIDTEDDAPRIIHDTEGVYNALLQYSTIIPISLYKIEL